MRVSLAVHLVRLHIIAIAALAALTFGWTFDGRRDWLVPLLVACDWFFVNLLNRVVDVAEDVKNGVPGADVAGRRARAIAVLCWSVLAAATALQLWLAPELTWLRVAFHAIGFAYNYKLIPLGARHARLKELYFWKNFSSGVLFVISVLLMPLARSHAAVPWPRVAVLAAFFLPLELTYEIIYDLRDVAGDRAEGIRTFPVVHGARASRWIVAALLTASGAALAAGWAFGAVRLREGVMLAAVAQQALAMATFLSGDVSDRAALGVTWLGAAQLASYNAWVALGLPLGK